MKGGEGRSKKKIEIRARSQFFTLFSMCVFSPSWLGIIHKEHPRKIWIFDALSPLSRQLHGFVQNLKPPPSPNTWTSFMNGPLIKKPRPQHQIL